MQVSRSASAVACVLTWAFSGIIGPAVAQDAATDPARDGRTIATLAGCASCHDSPDGRAFAGGLVLHTPFGQLAAPNITQDKATGIGTWDFDDFTNAIHRGLDNEGGPLYPAMPYTDYTKMTDADVASLWSYVRTIAPVENEVEVNRLPFPFSVRQSLYVWRELYFKDGRFTPDPNKDAVWNHGAYIVEALAHCGACHTPRDVLGGPVSSRALTGAPIEEWYAPDISNGPGSVIADWSVERIKQVLKGSDPANHVAVGSMHLVVGELSEVPAEDVHAIAVYLKDQPAREDASATPVQAEAPSPVAHARGQEIYAGNCLTCHGADGVGQPGYAASLVGAAALLSDSPRNVISVLLEGLAPRSDFGAMPTFRKVLSNEDIADVTNYVRTAWGNDAPPNALPSMVAGLRNVTAVPDIVLTAATCPPVASARVSEAIRDQIKSMAAPVGTPDAADVGAIVDAYRERNPDARPTQMMVDLGGLYCLAVAEEGATSRTVAAEELRFMDAVLAVGRGG